MISPANVLNLLQEDYTTVEVRFDENGNGNLSNKTYTYKVPLGWKVVSGDYVIVLTPYGTKAVKVVEAHETPQINFESSIAYKWAVQKVDLSFHNRMKEEEESFARLLLEVERKKQRQSMLKDFEEQLEPGSEGHKLYMDAAERFKKAAAASLEHSVVSGGQS